MYIFYKKVQIILWFLILDKSIDNFLWVSYYLLDEAITQIGLLCQIICENNKFMEVLL